MSYIIASSEGGLQEYLGLSLSWKIIGEQSLGSLALVEAVGSGGCEPPLHLHELADEFFYIVSGDMTFRVGEETKRIGDGGFVWIPRMTPHGFVIHTDKSRFLFGFVPAGLERMFTEIGTSVADSSSIEVRTASDGTTDSHRKRYGTVVVGPRLAQALETEGKLSN